MVSPLSPLGNSSPTRTSAKFLLGALGAFSGLAGLADTASILVHNAHKMLASDTPLTQPPLETLAQLQKAPVNIKLLQLAQSQGINSSPLPQGVRLWGNG